MDFLTAQGLKGEGTKKSLWRDKRRDWMTETERKWECGEGDAGGNHVRDE